MRSVSAFLTTLVIFTIGFMLGTMISLSENGVSVYTESVDISQTADKQIRVPAVDQSGNGVVTRLNVDIKNGTGRALVDINQLIFWADTQESIQLAKNVAGDVVGIDTSNIDVTYSIHTTANLIEGQSAGAALTIATVAALKNATIPDDVMITGTIRRDGTIGPVGGITEKARASKEMGVTTFLVPEGQSIIRKSEPVTTCKTVAGFEWCSIKFVETVKSVEEEVGIEVVEVPNIQEALKYFRIQV